ncbi:MazG nucleotide pyrophosphohydrolase domain-containing protein [Longispora albida]|uniref:MazG nucleotide pyrophosphohydrolase domain-containing protein n=1 Tax=Longispora albida TaxID=203523 RepID=UPI0003795D9C|nr:MazG nucleotide pyrophosphohydrolase domain-containing protein [Longispora albida]
MRLEKIADVAEAVSATYAVRHDIDRNDSWYLLKLHEEVGELTQAHLMRSGQARDKGYSAAQLDEAFRSELADVLCQLLVLARHHGVDLAAEVERKWGPWHPDRLDASGGLRDRLSE